MEGGDPDALLAYYMFVNHGWAPGQVDVLTDREKVLTTQFALKEIHSRPKAK